MEFGGLKMFWRSLSLIGVVWAVLAAAGCYNTETDYQALLGENNALSAELAEARQENEILTRALEDIKREQESLQLLLSAGKSNLNAGRISSPLVVAGVQARASGGDSWEEEWQAPQAQTAIQAPAAITPSPPAAAPVPAPPVTAPAAAPAPAASGRYYVTKPGDVLSNIARANNTTVNRILELNPNLRNRRNYMIYPNERLRMP
jgi:LysM repeat protein